jgi:hypothetical protein
MRVTSPNDTIILQAGPAATVFGSLILSAATSGEPRVAFPDIGASVELSPGAATFVLSRLGPLLGRVPIRTRESPIEARDLLRGLIDVLNARAGEWVNDQAL